jgi:autotransporter-associated beta strand protein
MKTTHTPASRSLRPTEQNITATSFNVSQFQLRARRRSNAAPRKAIRLVGAAAWTVTAIVATTILAPLSHAATFTWTNSASDYYTNAANWDLAAVPGPADTANIANNGTAIVTDQMTNVLQKLWFGGSDSSPGNVTMSGGVFSITNTEAVDAFLPGYWNNSSGTFTLNGGTLTVARPSSSTRYFQDSLQPGYGIGTTGALTVNNGTLNILCGLEVGISGDGSLNVNGGTVVANGWFTFGRGLTANQGYGSGTFNLSGGTVYVLKNGGTGDQVGLRIHQNSAAGTANISGGAIYCSTISLVNANNSGTATLSVSGGTIYVGNGGVVVGNGTTSATKVINVSGGTFRTVDLLPNSNGQGGLSTVLSDGTNWTWASANMPTINLNNSPGPGIVTFAPEPNRTITLNAPWAGPGGMTIAGPGTVVFGGANTYAGATTVSGGTLQLNTGQAASVISGLVVNSGATLALSSAQTSAPLGSALSSGSSLVMNNNAQIVDATLSLPGSATLRFNASNTQLFSNNVSGSGNVVATLSGNGVEVVTGNLGNSGTTIVSNGIVAIAGNLNSSSGVIVTNTGTLAGNGLIGAPITVASPNNPTAAHLRIGISPLNVPDTLTVTNLTLGAGSELDVKLGSSTTVGGGVNDLLVVRGNLTINPNAFVNVLPMQGLAAGTYVIVTYSGTLTGSFTNTIGGLTRYGFTLDYSTPGQIKLNVSGSNANLTYTGVTNNVAATNWDVLTTANWTNSGTLLADTFREGDAVTFNDTTRNTNIVLSTTLYPASITFSGNTNWSVTGTGSGRISGGTGITKNGNGTVLLAAGLGFGNDYTGPVQINGGILKMNGALSLGATNGSTTVASGATLDINGQSAGSEPLVIQGAGFGGTNGAINNSSATAPSTTGGPRLITLAGDATLNASGNRWDIGNNTLGVGGGSFAGNNHVLTKIGIKDIWMHELGDIGVGDILVNQGTLGFQYTIGMGDSSKTITVMPGATFGIWHVPGTLSKQVLLTNSTLYSDGEAGTSNVLNGAVTLAGTNTIQVNTGSLNLLGALGGTGGFQKTSPGQLVLSAANSYSGPTLINAGSVLLALSGGSIASSSLISVATNSVLDASLVGGLNLGSGRTLAGSGSVTGNVAAASGSQIAPGTFIAAGTLTLNNNLTLNAATNSIKLGGDPFTIGNGANDLIVVAGTLTASGVSTIQITPLGVLSSAGPYTVMQYSGTAPSAANFQVVSLSSRYTATLVDPATTPGSIQVSITGNPGLLVWKGGVATNANIWNNSATNWLNLSTGLRDAYLPGDNAIFDDTSVTNIANLATTAAGLISLSNNTTAYTVTGNGLITAALDMEGAGSFRVAASNVPSFAGITANSGTLIYDVPGVSAYTNYTTITDNGLGQGTIVKAGTNTMLLSSPNNSSFSGTIAITNGVLQYTNSADLGGGGALYATNGGTLDMAGIAPGSKNLNIAGNGFNGKGALISSSPNGLVNNGTLSLTMTGDASIAASNRWDIVGTIFNANGHSLTVLGPGSTLIELAGDGTLADIHIVAGRLGFQGSTSMGDTTRTCTVESNAVLTFFNAGTQTKNLTLNGNATLDSGGTATTFNGPITLVGTNNLFGLRVDLHLGGGIGGAGSLVVGDSPVGGGSGILYLDAGGMTYTGSTTINGGHSVVVGATSSLGVSSLIQVNSAATLDVSAPASFTLGAGQTLIGAGTVSGGAVVLGSGATLAPGLGGTSTASLAMTGTLSLGTGSTNVVVVNKTTGIANSKVTGLASVAIGGTLAVNTVGNPLSGGDAIPLFTAGSYSGGFANFNPPTPGAGLTWNTSTLLSDGTLRVSSTANPQPTNIVFSASGGQLSLSWPSDHTGWTLQVQTNNVLGTNWFDVPGSASTNHVFITIDPNTKDAFYRMILRQ